MHLRNFIARGISLLCVLILLASAILSANAAYSGSLSVSGLSASAVDTPGTKQKTESTADMSASWTGSGMTITGTITPGSSKEKSGWSTYYYPDKAAKTVLTLVNGLDSEAILSFKYTSANNSGTLTFSNNVSANGGEASALLQPSESITVTLTTAASPDRNKSSDNRKNYTTTTTLSGMTLLSPNAEVDVSLKSVAGGTFTISDGESTKNEGEKFSSPITVSYTLTANAPETNYQFDGWAFNGVKQSNTSMTLAGVTFKENTVVEALYIEDPVFAIAVSGDETPKNELVSINSRFEHQTKNELVDTKYNGNGTAPYYTVTDKSASGMFDTYYVPSLQWSKSGTTVTVSGSGRATGEYEASVGNSWVYANMVSDVIRIYAKEDCVIEFGYTNSLSGGSEETPGLHVYESTSGNEAIGTVLSKGTTYSDASGTVKHTLGKNKYLYVYLNGYFVGSSYTGMGGSATLNYTYNASISALTITANDTKYTQTTTFRDNAGNALGGGKLTVTGTAYSAASDGTVAIPAVPEGQLMQLSVATVPTNYKFLGWKVNGEMVYTPTYEYNLKSNTVVDPIFVPNLVTYDATNGTYQYKNISGNMVALNGQYVARNADFTQFYTSLEDAFKDTSAEVILLGSMTINGDFEVPSDEVLVIPCAMEEVTAKDGDTYIPVIYNSGSGAYATLTMNGNMTVNGDLVVSGQQTSSNGAPAGSYGQMTIGSGYTVTVSNGSALYGYGLVNGAGNILAKNGAKIHELCEIKDIPHPFIMEFLVNDADDYKIMPFNSYYINTIEAKTTYEAGAMLEGHLSIHYDYISQVAFPAIGYDSGILLVEEGSVTKHFDSTSKQIVFRVDEKSSVKTGSFSATLQASLAGISKTATIESGKFYLPVCAGYRFDVAGELTANHNIKMLPGSVMNVVKGGTLTVSPNINLVFYRLNDYDYRRNSATYNDGLGFSAAGYPQAITRYSTNVASIGSAKLNVDGNVVVKGGLYVTEQLIAENQETDTTMSFKNYTHYTNGYNYLTGTGRIDLTNAKSETATIRENQNNNQSKGLDLTTVTIVPIKGLPDGETADDPAKYVSLTEIANKKVKGTKVAEGVYTWGEDPCASGHTEEIDAAVGKTCTTNGKTEGKHCSVCGDILVAQEVIPAGHTPGTAATCTTAQECTVCHTQLAPATGAHSYTVEQQKVEATCGEDGYVIHKCATCEGTQKTTLPATGSHSYSNVVTAPTCTEKGYTTHTCSVCGDVVTDTEVPATGHDVKLVENGYTWTAVDGGYACTANGKCSKCNYTEAKSATVTSKTTVTATCQEEGEITYTATFASDVTWATTQTKVVNTGFDANNHTYSSEVTPPTCGEEGFTTYTCGCGHSYVGDTKPATGNHDLTYQSDDGTGHIPSCTVCNYTGEKQTHSYGDWIIDTEASCTTGGTKHQVCETCGYRNEGTIPALNHKDENKDHVCDNGCDVPQGEHADSATDKDHVCDYCGKAVENGEDCTDSASDGDHNCDVCGKENVTTCADTAPKNHVCDSDSACTAYSTGANEHKDSDKNHTCDYGCSEPIGTCSDAADDGDHVCDYGCGATKSECGDAAKDHVCDTDSACTAYSTDANEHKAAANSHNCAYCGEAVTSCVGNLDKTDENAATCEGTGVKAYWTCSVCGSHYSNEAATAKIENLETWKKTANQGLIAKLGHDMQLSAEAVAPSCEKNGATAVYTCTRNCGHTTGGEKVDALQHNWRVADPVWNGTASVSVSRTCTTVGGCQATETATSTSVKAEVTTQPTYNAKGQTTYTATFSETWASAQKTLTDVAMREGEARVGDTNYGTLADAVANVGQYNTIIVLKNLKVTTPVVIPEGVTVDFNGKTVSGTIAGPGKLALNGGNLITAEGKNMIGSGTENNYYTTNAVISISLDQRMDTIIHSGEVELAKDCWTLENQTLEIKSGATFTVREGIRLEVRSKVIVEGTAVVNGTVNLYSANATIKAASGLNVETTAGDKVLYQNGVYSVHNHTAGEAVVEDKNEPTCTETGSYNSVVYCSVCGDELSTTPVTVDALNHEWNATTYSWGTDGKFCTATRSCGRANCNETETATAEVTSAEKEAATCTEMGWTTYTASFNVTWAETQTQDKQDITVIAHTYTVEAVNENTLKSAATCTEKAVYYYSCQCGAVDMSENAKTFENGEKLGHTYGNPAVTFSEDGKTYTVTVTCSVCAEGNDGHTSTSDTLYSAAGDLVPGTCQAESYQIFTAAGTFEEVSYRDTKTVYGEKGDHSWKEEYGYTEIADSEYNVIGYTFYGSRKCEICSKEETATPTITCVETEKATCVRNGVGTYTVTFAEDWADMKTYAGLTTFVNANNHANEQDCQTQAATCTAVGYTGGKYCYACEVYTVPRTEVPALGHDIVIDAAVAPTCTTTGLTAGRHCSRCDDATVAQEEIRALGHTEATREEKRVEATCGEDGSYDLVTYCSVCNEVIKTENKVLNATGNHSDENPYDGSCDVCGTAMTPIHGGEAAIGNAIYPTLADAINAAQPGEFINIRANITSQPTNVTIAKNVTIITNGYSLWNADAVAAIESITDAGFKVSTNYGIIFVNEAGPEATYVAEVNGVKYTTVKEALENAQPGDTVVMINDSNESQSDMIMAKGVTLDLQDKTLQVRTLVGVEGSYLIGKALSRSAVHARLVADSLVLGEETADAGSDYKYVPVFFASEHENGGCYVILKINPAFASGDGLELSDDMLSFTFKYAPRTTGVARDKFTSEGYTANENDLRFCIEIAWTNEYGDFSMIFTFNDIYGSDAVTKDTGRLWGNVTGLPELGIDGSNIGTLKVRAVIVSDSGAAATSEWYFAS